jgi:RimJ/RimL family protein N-acetyltransferase
MTLLEQIPEETFREGSIPVLETERLILRAPCLADVKSIAALANDRRIAENTLRIPHPYGVVDAEAFVRTINAGENELAFVTTLYDGTVIGVCGIHDMAAGRRPEIGYWLGAPYWGRGYATELARALVDHAFNELGYDWLVAGARVSNPASRRVLEKCGFQWTGVGLYRIRSIRSSAPCDRFRLDRRLWASLRTWGRVQQVA